MNTIPLSWVNIKESLPNCGLDSDCVDVYSSSQGRLIDCSYVHNNYWETYHGDKIDDVTHWMPQPDSPITNEN